MIGRLLAAFNAIGDEHHDPSLGSGAPVASCANEVRTPNESIGSQCRAEVPLLERGGAAVAAASSRLMLHGAGPVRSHSRLG
jgi:hypothetical protein